MLIISIHQLSKAIPISCKKKAAWTFC